MVSTILSYKKGSSFTQKKKNILTKLESSYWKNRSLPPEMLSGKQLQNTKEILNCPSLSVPLTYHQKKERINK